MSNIPVNETREILQQLRVLLGQETSQIDAWEKNLLAIERRLNEQILRMAVVGTIKAGKSTLVNALLGQDILRRGAGILTAIITRVRYAPESRVSIWFKSHEVIRDELENAMMILGEAAGVPPPTSFDLQKQTDHEILEAFLENQQLDFAENHESFSQEWILLKSFLKGYDRIKTHIRPKESNILVLEDARLNEHQAFVSMEENAVYMKDVLLQLPFDLPRNFEIADCQGSDSPNPNHFAMVQQYLAQSTIVVYAISTRTGIRQADLTLLRTLKQLNLLEQTLFVANLDFNEHETIKDAQRVLVQITQDLSQWTDNPRLFGISALYQLIISLPEPRSIRMEQHLEIWREAPELLEFHKEQWTSLRECFNDVAHHSASQALIRSEQAHWQYLMSQVQHFIQTLIREMNTDHQQSHEQQSLLDHHSRDISKNLNAFEASLEGALKQLKQQISQDVDQLFSKDTPLTGMIYEFVQNYQLPGSSNHSGDTLIAQMVIMYKTLQRHLMTFIMEDFNAPLIVRLKQFQHSYIEHLSRISAPFFKALKVNDAQLIMKQEWHDLPPLNFPDFKLSMFSSTLNYHTREKMKSFLFLGKALIQQKLHLKEKKLDESDSEGIKARFWKDALIQLKKDALNSLDFDVDNYRENIKYMVLYEGVKQLAETLLEDFRLKVQLSRTDFGKIIQNLQSSRDNTETLLHGLNCVDSQLRKLVLTTQNQTSPD
ncbi:MAG: dynamin family protein [SAR324 cluster bacterium]|nr:dynamin family protein [SAR324 cluster bacterium]